MYIIYNGYISVIISIITSVIISVIISVMINLCKRRERAYVCTYIPTINHHNSVVNTPTIVVCVLCHTYIHKRCSLPPASIPYHDDVPYMICKLPVHIILK